MVNGTPTTDGIIHQPSSADYVLSMEVTQYKTIIERLVKEKTALETENLELKSKVLELESQVKKGSGGGGGFRPKPQAQAAHFHQEEEEEEEVQVSPQPQRRRRPPKAAAQRAPRAQPQHRQPEPPKPQPATEHDRQRVTELLQRMMEDCADKLEGIIPIIEVRDLGSDMASSWCFNKHDCNERGAVVGFACRMEGIAYPGMRMVTLRSAWRTMMPTPSRISSPGASGHYKPRHGRKLNR